MKGIITKTINFQAQLLQPENISKTFAKLEHSYLSKEEEDKELISVIYVSPLVYKYYFRYK